MKKYFFILFSLNIYCQNIDVGNPFFYNELNQNQIDSIFSYNILPINVNYINSQSLLFNYRLKKITNQNSNIIIKLFPIENSTEFNSNFPYKSNNGIMLPNVGLQNVFSTGFFLKYGKISLKIKPEFHFMENRFFEEFSKNHFPVIWERRYRLWNNIDMPVRFGNKSISNISIGQSNIFLEIKNINIGFSNENLWWGPSRYNSIMMSNNSSGFNHFTIQNAKPFDFSFGKIEFKYLSGRLKSSGFNPPNVDGLFSGTKYYIPKKTRENYSDTSKLNAFIFSISPNLIEGLSLGIIRWMQFYKENEFINLDIFSTKFINNPEKKQNKASGYFMRYRGDNIEFYFEYNLNSPSYKNSIEQVLSYNKKNAHTIGISKSFKNNFYLNWEWTRMEQNSNNLINKIGSWYEHDYIVNGFTHNGEVLGSKIGPGSNSQTFTLNKSGNKFLATLGFEIVENDNDFYHFAFSDSKDFRRYWKDFSLMFNIYKELNNFNLGIKSIYTRSLNYTWDLDRNVEPWYHAGFDKNNFYFRLVLNYFL